MQITTFKILLVAALLGQSDAFLFRWKRINPTTCAWLPGFGGPDSGCPGGAAVPPPVVPAPDPKKIAQDYCTGIAVGAIAVFRADGSHYGCFNEPCVETWPGSNEMNGVCR